MQFNINNISVKISFSFFALMLFFLITDKTDVYLITLVSALFHETVHIIFIYAFGGSVSEISFSLLGGNIKRNNYNGSYLQEAVINISAPVSNLILALFFSKCIHIFQINLVLGVFNILPFYTFDGGHFTKNILCLFIREKAADKTLTVVSVVITVCFAFLGVYIYLYSDNNFSLIIISVYCFVSILFKK